LLLVLCLGTAWFTSLAGLSLALGAFLAGLAISESEYSHQAMAEAIPFRDAFGSMFFISIGMLMDVSFLFSNLPLVLLVVLALVAIKAVTCAVPVLLLGYPLSLALQVGLGLAQVGEFAFVLSRSGLKLQLIDDTEYQVFLSASVLSMILTPVLLYVGNLAKDRLPQTRTVQEPAAADSAGGHGGHPHLERHVLIAGYGVNGQNLAHALATTGIPYAILEMNPETVRSARERGEPLHYGDCTRLPVLSSLGIERARMFVVAISDATSTRQAVSIARTANPDVFILVRTRFVSEIDELRRLGANEVIPEEFETSVEIFARVLHSFDVPRNVILDFVSKVRGDMYEMLRQPRTGRTSVLPIASGFEGITVESLEVRPGSPGVGRTLLELEVRAKTGASVLAIRRGSTAHPNPDPQQQLEVGDVLMVMGSRTALDAALGLFDPEVPVV
jgi:CPA2 family monovalent cation:H+ antiporter-2